MRVKIIIPELADVTARLAEGVDTGVRVTGGRVGGDGGVGGVGVGPAPTPEREHAADSEARGAGGAGCSSQGLALYGGVAHTHRVGAAHIAGRVGEVDDREDSQQFVVS